MPSETRYLSYSFYLIRVFNCFFPVHSEITANLKAYYINFLSNQQLITWICTSAWVQICNDSFQLESHIIQERHSLKIENSFPHGSPILGLCHPCLQNTSSHSSEDAVLLKVWSDSFFTWFLTITAPSLSWPLTLYCAALREVEVQLQNLHRPNEQFLSLGPWEAPE